MIRLSIVMFVFSCLLSGALFFGTGYALGLNSCRPITKEFHTTLAPDHGAGHRTLRRWHRDLVEKRPRTERAICIVEEVR